MLSGCQKEETAGCEYADCGKEFVEDGREEEEEKSGQCGVGVKGVKSRERSTV